MVNVSLSQASYEFGEGASDAEVCVSLSALAERSVTVLLSTTDETATGNY